MLADREGLAFYVQTLRRLSPQATWTGAGIGRDQLTLARWSLELGGHCRTGMEDNVWPFPCQSQSTCAGVQV
jgi:3-keto-5-aminohexanoate cleavage enzyme